MPQGTHVFQHNAFSDLKVQVCWCPCVNRNFGSNSHQFSSVAHL